MSIWRNTLLKQVKSYSDNNISSAKVSVLDSIKDSQPLSAREILDQLKIFKDDYCRALSISKDEDLELCLNRKPNSCSVNNFFDVDLNVGSQV